MSCIKGNKMMFAVEFFLLVKKYFGAKGRDLGFDESLGFFLSTQERIRAFDILYRVGLLDEQDIEEKS